MDEQFEWLKANVAAEMATGFPEARLILADYLEDDGHPTCLAIAYRIREPAKPETGLVVRFYGRHVDRGEPSLWDVTWNGNFIGCFFM